MGNLLYEIGLSLGRMARRRGAIPVLLLFPAAVFLWAILFPPDTLEQPAQVGLCPPEEPSQAAQELCRRLLEDSGGYVRFVQSDPDTARDRVAAGVWDCAFVLEEGFDQALERGRAPIRLIISRGSVLAGPAQEAVASALIQVRCADLAGEYLAGSGLMPDAGQAARQVEAILHNDRPMTVIYAGGEEGPPSLVQSTAAPVLRGLAALLLLSNALLTGAGLRRDRRSSWYIRARSVAGEGRLLISYLSGRLLPPLAACALAVGAGALLLPGFAPVGWELGCLALYQLCLIPLALLASYLPGAEALMGVCLPYGIIGCVLLCPILFDAGLLVDGLYPLSRALPPTWYLTAAQPGSPLPLFIGCAVLWVAALLPCGVSAIWKRKGKACSVTDAARP